LYHSQSKFFCVIEFIYILFAAYNDRSNCNLLDELNIDLATGLGRMQLQSQEGLH